MSKLFFLLFLAIFGGGALADITNTNFINLPNNTYGAFVFYYSNQIVVGLNILNGPSTGVAPYIRFYSTAGVLQNTLTLSATCTVAKCNAQMMFISVDGNLLNLQVIPNALMAKTFQFVTVNLATRTVVQSNPSSSLYISSYLPVDAAAVPFTIQSTSNASFGTLDVDTLTPNTPATTKLLHVNSGNTVVLSDKLYICGSELHSQQNTFVQATTGLALGTNTNLDCTGFTAYQSSLTQVAWVKSAADLVLKFYDIVTNGLSLYSGGGLTLATGVRPTGLAVSANYAFASGSNGNVYQVSTTTGAGTLLDSVTIPNSYKAASMPGGHNSVVDESSMTYSLLAVRPGSFPPALVILTFNSL